MLRHIAFFLCFVTLHLHAFSPEEYCASSPSQWGVCMVDRKTGETLCEINGNKRFVPASVTKLYTTTVALEQLGPDYHFNTTVYALTVPTEDGVLSGDIYLNGSGDSLLTNESLQGLAKKVAKKVKCIEGQVRVNDETDCYAPHIEWEDMSEGYAQEITFLCINDNCMTLKIQPGQIGERAEVLLIQEIPYANVINNLVTDPVETNIKLMRGLADNTITLSGVIAVDSETHILKVPLHKPEEYARQLFMHCLLKEGVEVLGKDLSKEITILPYFELASIESPRLLVFLSKCNKYSHNLSAEIIKRILPPNALESFLTKEKIPFTGCLYDGSGMSRHNLATPNEVVKLLQWIDQSDHKIDFISTLPVAGVEGTLATRFRNTHIEGRLLAKSGLLTNIANLAGYAMTSTGREVIFCIFLNCGTKDNREEVDNFVLNLFSQY